MAILAYKFRTVQHLTGEVDMNVLRSNRMSERQVNRFYRHLLDERIEAYVVPVGANEFCVEIDAAHLSKAILVATRIGGTVTFSR
jgi:nitrate reductase beta subunit